MTNFDLQRIVDRELDSERSVDPHGVARNALMRIAPEHREEALLVAPATYCETRIYERQGDGMPSSTYPAADSVRTAQGSDG